MTAERGLERLYREDSARLWRALVAFSGDREVASDAVAEAFAQAGRVGDDVGDEHRIARYRPNPEGRQAAHRTGARGSGA